MENEENKEQEQVEESPEATGTEPIAEVGNPPEGTGHAPDLGDTTGSEGVSNTEETTGTDTVE